MAPTSTRSWTRSRRSRGSRPITPTGSWSSRSTRCWRSPALRWRSTRWFGWLSPEPEVELEDMVGPVRTEVVDGVLVVTLDRPKANAVDVVTSHALYDAFAR